ncbi:ricin-domain containing protein [Rhyzopertha dominica]|nr:ricin-domain containing protein [Rhyzopertha dominica]
MLVTLAFLHATAFCLQSVNDHVQVQPCKANTGSQVWEIVSLGDGTHVILNDDSPNVLQAEHENCQSGTDIVTSPVRGGINQRWYINYDGTITSFCNTDTVLDTYGHNVTNGTRIVLGEKNSNSSISQVFKINKL